MTGTMYSCRTRNGGWLRLPRGRAYLLCLALLFAPSAYAEKYALLIGLNEYASVRSGIVELKYALNDVQALESQLKKIGFTKIRRFHNEEASRGAIIRELNRYAEIVQPNDTFLIYFAGHGVRRKPGETIAFWLTYHAQLEWLDDQGIRLTHLMEYLRDIRATQKIVLLDHCYSGHIVDAAGAAGPVDVGAAAAGGAGATGGAGPDSRGPGSRSLGLSGARGQGSVDQLYDQVRSVSQAAGILTIAAAHDEAYEASGNGYFTQALLKALSTREASGGEPRLTATRLVSYLRTEVPKLSGGKQQIREWMQAADASTWVIVDALPEAIADLTAVRAKRDRYSDRLSSWENQGFLTFDVRMRCERALSAWLKSQEPNGPALTTESERIFAQIESHMNDRYSPQENAEDLARQLARIAPET